jgi:competence protein ComEC
MLLLEWLNALPQAVWTQHAPPAWSIATGMLGAMWILLPRGFPMRWLGILLMLPMFLNTPAAPPAGTLRLVVFDVGQGLAVAAQTQHHALLYDSGPDLGGAVNSGHHILIPALRALGIARLDGLILTHDDSDHTGGAAALMQAMPIDWVSSSLPDNHALLHNYYAGAATNQTHPAGGRGESRRCMDGQSWEWDGVQFEMLHPAADSYAVPGAPRHDNEQGCVLLISRGAQRILLSADIEATSERRLLEAHADKLNANLLLVPHHGSKTSSTPEFIAAVQPDYAVFTVGYRNRFGHPKAEVLQRYADSGAQLLRSDEDGAILVEMNAQGLQVVRYRATHRRYWTHSPPPRKENSR